jgi:class I fructose-bisphosphate aldolase
MGIEKIIKNGKTVIIPMDHGISCGPMAGLENMQEIVDKVAKGGADAIVVHKGIAKHVEVKGLGLIIHLSASTDLGDSLRKVLVGTVEEAVSYGADAVSVHVNIGAPTESEMLKDLGKVSGECAKLGVPLLAMMYHRGHDVKDPKDTKNIAHVARVGYELGADIIKCPFTENFSKVTSCVDVPVVIAGGAKSGKAEDILLQIKECMEQGGAGVSIGRNAFQADDPEKMVKAIREIVHGNKSVEDALKVVNV